MSIKVNYRGFRNRPLFSLKSIRIGRTRLFILGPMALFITGRSGDGNRP